MWIAIFVLTNSSNIDRYTVSAVDFYTISKNKQFPNESSEEVGSNMSEEDPYEDETQTTYSTKY